MRGVIVGGRVVAAFSDLNSRMVPGQRTSDGSCPAHVDHTGEKASMGLSSCGWERKKSGTAVSEMRDGGSKKERSWSYFLLVLDVPFVGGPWVWGVCVWGLILE